MSDNKDAIKKQIEYYFSDKNLSKDKFFHNKISADKEGWVDISFIMNCNKVKQLSTVQEEIVEAINESEEVEFDTGGVRRKDNKPLPELVQEEKKEEVKQEPQDDGMISERDFKNPKIIQFHVKSKSEETKEEPSWRDLENLVAEKFASLKLLYSRQKEFVGQIAISNRNLDEEALGKLMKETITIGEFDYTFEDPKDDDLKEFWEQHGSHYEMCQKQKLRKLRKRKREERQANGGDDKRQKVEEEEKTYTIAAVTYANINKVKSKAKTIMNIKDDGQKLEGYEEEFMKEIIKNHDKHDEKMKDFSHFIVDEHPNYRNTRCFFVVRADGTKEDFSMSKCIKKMEEGS